MNTYVSHHVHTLLQLKHNFIASLLLLLLRTNRKATSRLVKQAELQALLSTQNTEKLTLQVSKLNIPEKCLFSCSSQKLRYQNWKQTFAEVSPPKK